MEAILGKGAPNGTTDDTIALTDELMSGPGLLTIDATRLINVMGTTIVSMITRVLVVLFLLSIDKVTTMLPDNLMSGQQLVLRITNNHQLRMAEATDGCHHRPPLLLCLTLVFPLLYRLRLMLKGPADPLPLTLHLCFPLMLLQFEMLLMITLRNNLP